MKSNFKSLNLVLSNSTHKGLERLARKEKITAEKYAELVLTDIAADNHSARQLSSAAVESAPRSSFQPASPPRPSQRIAERELMSAIIELLKSHPGAAAPKIEVEKAVYDKYKTLFHDPFYKEFVGGGVPRWRKNVQFARNTAKNLGLIKDPQECGRGIWELTEIGKSWDGD